ncbi:sulfite exporter TauE/SafE family protein [Candidatus Pseudothioglobus singularis]|nr:sulfite exporter TauE/SafE family protein [Candidatus Pseudothioglobus singularis]MDB4847352.1 sulfite exporter TauE/SafE family protein [Candidatus Pseudothioglobus singularis]
MEDFFNFIPDNYFLIVVVVVFSGLLRGFIGFGSGLLMVPILSYFYSPIFAMVFNIVIEIPATIYLTFVGAKKCNFKEISPMMFTMMLTIPFGTVFLVSIDEQVIKILMSILLIFFVILIAIGWRIKATITRYVLVLGGIISGLMQGATGMGGPPYVTVLLSKNDSDEVARANILVITSGLVISAIISLYYFGLFTKNIFLTGIVTAPIYVFSTYLGSKFFNHSGNKYFRNSSLITLGIVGIATLIGAFV